MTYTDHNGRGIELRLNWQLPINSQKIKIDCRRSCPL